MAEVLNKNNLSELEYEDEKCRISIKSALCVSANTVAQFAQTENKNICVQKENDNVKEYMKTKLKQEKAMNVVVENVKEK